MEVGDPSGIRTRVAAVKGRCPRPLDDGVVGVAEYQVRRPNIPSLSAVLRAGQQRRYPEPVAPTSGFEILGHVADTAFRCWGTTFSDCLAAAGEAFLSLAVETESISETGETSFEIDGDAPGDILVDALNELIFLIDANAFAPKRIIEAKHPAPGRWVIRLAGEEPRDPAKHPWKLIIKAATYHDLEAVERNGRWEAKVILDV